MRIPRLLAMALLAGSAAAQSPPSGSGRGSRVTGVVYDSLAAKPLAAARVQLVAADGEARVTVSDGQGAFRFDSVARGRYVIGFFHAVLDSLTLQPMLREVVVGDDRPVDVALFTPSAARLRAAFCGARTTANSAGALVGIVRDAKDGSPVGGASVLAEWTEVSLGRGTISRSPAHRLVTSAPSGWFALCGVPSPGVMQLSVARGADTSDHVDVQVPASGFARREMYLGSAMAGQLSGTVTTIDGRPVPEAIIGLPQGPRTRANAAGEWTLSGIPAGTRILEVRAIGYYPDRRAVDVFPEAPPVQVRLATFESVLDTVRIRATGYTSYDQGGFEERKRSSGTGRFITEADIARRAPVVVSDMFKGMSGMRLEMDSIMMRGAFANLGTLGDCAPALFIDGRMVPMPGGGGLSTNDLDMWVRPGEIKGIEVYHDAPPPQFQVALSGCGSIVIWTKRLRAR